MLEAGDQPPRAAWAKLIAELRQAGTEMNSGKALSSQLSPGMVPVLRSLTAVVDYLNASAAGKADPRIPVALMQLMAALYKAQVGPGASRPPERPEAGVG
jgi:hypothetical protein